MLTIAGDDHTLDAGSIAIVPPNAPHGFERSAPPASSSRITGCA
jgi:quercetin dioxygenase-like cupin family protein